jgi:hypothetical protein
VVVFIFLVVVVFFVVLIFADFLTADLTADFNVVVFVAVEVGPVPPMAAVVEAEAALVVVTFELDAVLVVVVEFKLLLVVVTFVALTVVVPFDVVRLPA